MPPEMVKSVKPGWKLLRAWREGRGLSQNKAGSLIGVRQATWCEWEREDTAGANRGPGRDIAVRLEALTDGAVPVESWSQSAEVAEAMRKIAKLRHGR